MIIEYCGVPGGGKTTAARIYVASYPDTTFITLPMDKRLQEMQWALCFAFWHPIAFASLLAFVARYGMSGLRWYSIHLALRACAKYALAGRSMSDAVIDEGLVHAVMTLPSMPLPESLLGKIMVKLPLPDRVLIATAGDFHRFEKKRDVPHPRTLQGEEVLATWQDAVRANVAAGERILRGLSAERIELISVPNTFNI